jgi:hypothetical protein
MQFWPSGPSSKLQRCVPQIDHDNGSAAVVVRNIPPAPLVPPSTSCIGACYSALLAALRLYSSWVKAWPKVESLSSTTLLPQGWTSRVVAGDDLGLRRSTVRLFIAVNDDAFCGRRRRRMALPLDPTDASAVRCRCDDDARFIRGRRRREHHCSTHKTINRAALFYGECICMRLWWRFAIERPSLTRFLRRSFMSRRKVSTRGLVSFDANGSDNESTMAWLPCPLSPLLLWLRKLHLSAARSTR